MKRLGAASLLFLCRSFVGSREIRIRKGQFDAYRANRPVNGGDPAEALWWNRTRSVLAHRGADRARSRRDAVRQRRLADLGQARSGMAPGIAARRRRARSERLA